MTIFIDRDGVINKDPGGWTKHNYVTEAKDFHFLPGALEALKLLNRSGSKVIVVSNQAGVNKGYFTRKELNDVTSKMLDEIGKHGGRIAEVCYCVHKDEDNCSCRKPKTALFETAARRHGINLNGAYFIGDTHSDIVAGRDAGCKTILVLSGKSSSDDAKKMEAKPDYVFKDLLEAVKWILNKEKRRSMRAERREREERK